MRVLVITQEGKRNHVLWFSSTEDAVIPTCRMRLTHQSLKPKYYSMHLIEWAALSPSGMVQTVCNWTPKEPRAKN